MHYVKGRDDKEEEKDPLYTPRNPLTRDDLTGPE